MKTPSIIATVLAAFLVSAGCAKRETDVEKGLSTKTLHIGNTGEPATLDPHLSTYTAERVIIEALYEGLGNLANDGRTPLPGVAKRWEVSPDGLTYIFHLRADARWSNGDLISAADFLESWQRQLDPRIASPVENLYDIVGAKAYVSGESTDFSTVGMRALDPRTLEIKVQSRSPYVLTVCLALVPVHLASIDAVGSRYDRGTKWTVPGKLVTNGPFILQEWRHDQVIVLARNPHYWDRARVRLNEVRFYPDEDGGVEERSYRTGQLQVTSRLPPNKIDHYRRDHAAELQQEKLLHTTIVTFNIQRPPFNDPRVRRAFSLAIDREVIVSKVLNGLAQPAHSLTRPGMGGFEPAKLTVYDPAAAQRGLAEAGFPGGGGFPAVEFRYIAEPEIAVLAESLQAMWQQTLGVRVALRQAEGKTHVAALRSHDFQFGTVGFYPTIDDPGKMLQLAETGFSSNSAGWSDPRFEAAFAVARAASSETARFAAFQSMERLISEEAPYAPLFHWNRLRLVHPTVRGWQSNPVSRIDWRELWLEAPR